MTSKFWPLSKHSQISVDVEFWSFCAPYKAYSALRNTTINRLKDLQTTINHTCGDHQSSKKQERAQDQTHDNLLLQMRTRRARILWLSAKISIHCMKELYICKIMLNAIDLSKSNSCSVVAITSMAHCLCKPCLVDLSPVQTLLRNILLPLCTAAVTHC